jgi:hypothetical protein
VETLREVQAAREAFPVGVEDLSQAKAHGIGKVAVWVPLVALPADCLIGTAGCRAGEGLPSSRRHYRHVPRPIRRGVLRGCASRLFTASVAFTLDSGARLSLLPPEGETSNDAAGFASCYGPHRCSPCYRASWQLPGPDSHRQATTSLRTARSTMAYVTVPPPTLLGARKPEANSTASGPDRNSAAGTAGRSG